jgi:hypothetical protein
MDKKNKVYLDRDQVWFVDETFDYYYFKAINIITKEEKEYILSWNRSVELKEESGVVRIYDVEIETNEGLKKYYFNFYYEENRYKVLAKDSMELEKLLRETNLSFLGEVKPD